MTPICFVSLLPGPSDECDDVPRCVIELGIIIECTIYDVISSMTTERGDGAQIRLDSSLIRVSTSLFTTLSYMRSRITSPQRLWIEELFLGDEPVLKEENQQRKHIHENAREIILRVNATDCPFFMDYFLEPAEHSANHSLSFAHQLAAAEVTEILSLLESHVNPRTGLHSWFYLIQILYGDWFLGAPVLNKNYIAQLPNFNIHSGSSRISWTKLMTASHRLRVAHPVPSFLLRVKIAPDTLKLLFLMDKLWINANFRFGWSIPATAIRLTWLGLREVGLNSGALERVQIATLLTICHWEHQPADLQREINGAERAIRDGEDIKPPCVEAFSAIADPPTPLAIINRRPPPASEQAKFVPRPANLRTEIPLVDICPHRGDPAAPVQCEQGLSPLETPNRFVLVLNATLHHPRHTVFVLINGRSIQIPKILELFLRCIRDRDKSIPLFIWRMCAPPAEQQIREREELDAYVSALDILSKKAAIQIDMYKFLEHGDKKGIDDVPEGLTWDEWLLELQE